MNVEISVPEGSSPVASRPHRINPTLAEEGGRHSRSVPRAGLIQHSTSPYSSPLGTIPKTSGGVRITVNDKKLNQISNPSQLSHPSRGSGPGFVGQRSCAFSLRLGVFNPSDHRTQGHGFTDVFSSFPPACASGSSCPRAAMHRPVGLSKVINEVTKSLE